MHISVFKKVSDYPAKFFLFPVTSRLQCSSQVWAPGVVPSCETELGDRMCGCTLRRLI